MKEKQSSLHPSLMHNTITTAHHNPVIGGGTPYQQKNPRGILSPFLRTAPTPAAALVTPMNSDDLYAENVYKNLVHSYVPCTRRVIERSRDLGKALSTTSTKADELASAMSHLAFSSIVLSRSTTLNSGQATNLAGTTNDDASSTFSDEDASVADRDAGRVNDKLGAALLQVSDIIREVSRVCLVLASNVNDELARNLETKCVTEQKTKKYRQDAKRCHSDLDKSKRAVTQARSKLTEGGKKGVGTGDPKTAKRLHEYVEVSSRHAELSENWRILASQTQNNAYITCLLNATNFTRNAEVSIRNLHEKCRIQLSGWQHVSEKIAKQRVVRKSRTFHEIENTTNPHNNENNNSSVHQNSRYNTLNRKVPTSTNSSTMSSSRSSKKTTDSSQHHHQFTKYNEQDMRMYRTKSMMNLHDTVASFGVGVPASMTSSEEDDAQSTGYRNVKALKQHARERDVIDWNNVKQDGGRFSTFKSASQTPNITRSHFHEYSTTLGRQPRYLQRSQSVSSEKYHKYNDDDKYSTSDQSQAKDIDGTPNWPEPPSTMKF